MRAAAAVLLLLAACGETKPADTPPFESASIELPAGTATLPASAPLVEAKCAACHSLDMITAQPRMPAEKWAATVKKMREVYHAPVLPTEDAAIAAELAGLQSR